MGFFDKLNKPKGGYIFLSHSHDDIEKVREIRNDLEKNGFEPLCFYLKCLDKDSEIEDLIKREIDAREWFVFVNSENSRKSKWVNLEREYITRTDRKKIITVDIDDERSIADSIHILTHNLRVFISYSSRDMHLARRIKNKLEDKDYLVFFAPDSIPDASSYSKVITNAITEASQEGCVVALITQNSANSDHFLNEFEYALSKKGNIIPVIVGDMELTGELKYYLHGQPIYALSEDPTDEELDAMIDKIGKAVVKQ